MTKYRWLLFDADGTLFDYDKAEAVALERTFGQMGHPRKEEVLMVGDSLTSDIEGGNRYGIDTCWFNPAHQPRDGHFRATYEISRLAELLKLL